LKPKHADWLEQAKKAVAKEAVKHVKNGSVIGLGSGTTVAYAIEELGKRHLQILVVPSSYQAFLLAAQHHIQITTLDEHPRLNLTIDGADQVEMKTLNMIKGMGGALTREKIVITASRENIIIIDKTKLASKLGVEQPVPVEVLPFALATVKSALQTLKGKSHLREGSGKIGPVVTDNGNFIIDTDFGAIRDAEKLDTQIKCIPGVVETGLFLNKATIVYVGTEAKVEKLTKP
jgi:ribose 5-phosphate isomerase A